MAKPTQLPLHLCQVLEEEYANLHRQLDPKPTWEFKGGQVKDAQGLSQKLREAASDSSMDRMSRYVRSWFSRLAPDLLRTIDEGGVPDANSISEAFNLLLPEASFYSRLAFADVRLPESTEQFVVLGTKNGSLSFTGDDLKRFNRLLIEGAYPEEFAEIYEVRLANIFSLIHAEKPAALCLSGGGIRSGTFCLGVIQGLARNRMLQKFHYLSTVSGGGYTGGWLSAWINRHPRGLQGVAEDIIHEKPKTKIVPDAEPVQHMREYGSFVTPKFSLLSADVWTFVTIYFRNLMLNWLVIIPLMLAALAFPRFYLSLLWERPTGKVSFVIFVLAILLSGLSVAYMAINRPSVADALKRSRFWSRWTGQGGFLIFCLTPFTLSVFLFSLNWAWFRNWYADIEYLVESQTGLKVWSWVVFAVIGLVIHFIGWLVSTLILRRFRIPELLAVFVTGPVGGVITWLVIQGAFSKPVQLPVQVRSEFSYLEDALTINPTTGLYASFAIPLFMVSMFIAVTFFVGLTSRRQWDSITRRGRAGGRAAPSGSVTLEDEDREWLARYSAWTLIVAIIWAAGSLLVIFGPLAIYESPKLVASVGGASGLIALLVGKSAKTPGGGERKSDQKSIFSVLLEQSLSVLALLFLVVLIAVLSFMTTLLVQGVGSIDFVRSISGSQDIREISSATRPEIFTEVVEPEKEVDETNTPAVEEPSQDYTFDPLNRSILAPIIGDEYGAFNLMKVMYFTPYWFVGLLALLLLIAGMLVSRLINLNKFSLHAGYRNRIIRAFLGASRSSAERKPNPFTGFDPSDNIQMHELRPNLLRDKSFKKPEESRDSGLVRMVVKLRDAKEDKESIRTDTSAYLKSRLSAETAEMLRNHRGSNEPSPSLKKNIIEDLNRCLEEDNFLDAKAFERFKSSQRTQNFISTFAHGALFGDYLIYMNRLLLVQAYPDDFADWRYPPPPYRLLHVVNTCLNLVGGDKLAWQQRKAEAFSVSPLHCGSLFVGYRKSKDYGGDDGISLGTAVAISGAAVSSNMGYHSASSAITFVLTFFNARLGWWLGNPGPAGDGYYDKAHPKHAIYPLLTEAFGLTDDKNAYVLLSDGGQFENLGLYEMVLRRNHYIVLVDGGADPKVTFEDLGNAVRKIRIDMGIEVEFDEVKIYGKNDPEKRKGLYCAIGKIYYDRVDAGARPGYLVYIKPAYYGDEPRDVFNYGQANEEFPHESTADQFFDEPQFESHRKLGAYIMDKIVGEYWEGQSLEEFVNQIETHYLNSNGGPPQFE
ncbi:MAG TPA: hypothetical protein VE262_02895 [Blastocatellia bacterium]|nr:hypothetical protein [Blastocatellia bacterium]